MEKIATDTYSFKDLREGGFVYVDKTRFLKPLVDGSIGKLFFIARPRRFGKSLAISTLQCLFEGRRELFRGLAIEPEWDWTKKWPVIHLDLGTIQATTPEELKLAIVNLVRAQAVRFGVGIDDRLDPASVFRNVVEAVADQGADGKCVILVDEYDKPLLNHLGDADVACYQQILKPFYGVIKYTEGRQRFALVTGVSKFSKVSIFSDLNNLNEFSMDARVAELFGYTHEEVKANFPESLKALGRAYGWSDEETFSTLVAQYDGYLFEESAHRMFNPVSVGRCLSSLKVQNFWFETGTPTFLLKLLKANPVNLDNVVLDADSFSVYEPVAPGMMALLYQTGYLTIKDSFRDGLTTMYRLGFPNGEVRTAFSKAMANEFADMQPAETTSFLNQMIQGLRNDDVDDMLDALSCFFANIPANITVKREKYYQSLFYAVFLAIGARVQAECWTNRGRVDSVVETANGVFVFEFKLDGTAEAALKQINDRGYYEKYLRSDKKLTLVGAAFDAEMRNLSDRRVAVV